MPLADMLVPTYSSDRHCDSYLWASIQPCFSPMNPLPQPPVPTPILAPGTMENTAVSTTDSTDHHVNNHVLHTTHCIRHPEHIVDFLLRALYPDDFYVTINPAHCGIFGQCNWFIPIPSSNPECTNYDVQGNDGARVFIREGPHQGLIKFMDKNLKTFAQVDYGSRTPTILTSLGVHYGEAFCPFDELDLRRSYDPIFSRCLGLLCLTSSRQGRVQEEADIKPHTG